MIVEKLKLNCSLDKLLEGGIEAGIVTEIYGEGGTGKTNICIQAAKSCVENGKRVVYIDSEGVSKERLLQVFKDKKKLEKILFFFPYSLKEQEEMVEKAIKIDAGLIILDSANLFYRLEMDEDEAKATRSLTKQLVTLQIEARKKNIPVIITNQVYHEFLSKEEFEAGKKAGTRMVGGDLLKYWSKCLIELKVENGKRKAILRKHRSLREKELNFIITNKGIKKRGWI